MLRKFLLIMIFSSINCKVRTNIVKINFQNIIEMYKIECETIEKTIFDNMVCEIKSLSREVQTINAYFDILTKIEESFVVNLEMTSKTSTNAFKNLFLNTTANLCGNISDRHSYRL